MDKRALLAWLAYVMRRRCRGIREQAPFGTVGEGWQQHLVPFPVRVHDHVHVLVGNGAALGVPAAAHDRQHPAVRIPVRLPRARPMPAQVRESAANIVSPGRVVAIAEAGVSVPERDDGAREPQQLLVYIRQPPVDPRTLAVRALGAVVTLLSA